VQAKRFVLEQSTTSATVSLATVGLRVSRKTKLRAFLSQAQVSPGYVTGYSNFIRAQGSWLRKRKRGAAAPPFSFSAESATRPRPS
jgi:ribosomal protein L28